MRMSMGLSFHDESSMVEFPPDITNPTSENGIIGEEKKRLDDSEIQLGGDSDIQTVDRWL